MGERAIHLCCFSLDTVIKETIPAMIRAKEAGKTRFVGITGYPLENFRTVIERESERERKG